MEAYKNPHKRRNRFARFCYIAATICLMGQAILILASWLWTAAMPESNVRSLLSSAGIRWFFGSFADNEASVLLVWLILLSITWGTILHSGTASAIRLVFSRQSRLLGSQKLLALELAAALLVVELIIVSLLVFVPHAVLLSVTGNLFPGPFSASIIPTVSFMFISSSVFYGMMCDNLHSLTEIFDCLCSCKKWIMPLLFLYITGRELWCSLCYVLP
jgi:hypothetical protein